MVLFIVTIIFKLLLFGIAGVAVSFFIYSPEVSVEVDGRALATRNAVVFALAAATFFLISLLPPRQSSNLQWDNLCKGIDGFLQLMAGIGTFASVIFLLETVDAPFTFIQFYGVWAVVVVGLVAGVVCFAVHLIGMFRR